MISMDTWNQRDASLAGRRRKRGWQTIKKNENTKDYTSSMDRAIANAREMKEFMENKFPNKSKYEK